MQHDDVDLDAGAGSTEDTPPRRSALHRLAALGAGLLATAGLVQAGAANGRNAPNGATAQRRQGKCKRDTGRDWLAANPAGYLLNLGRPRTVQAMTHGAGCGHIGAEGEGRSNTGRDKWCSVSRDELAAAAGRPLAGVELVECGDCGGHPRS